MKIKILILSVCVLTGVFLMQPIHAEPSILTHTNTQSVTLDLQNMTCPMCKYTIKKALQGVNGVQKVNVDYDSKTAAVTFNPQKTNNEALIKATTNAGYPSSVREAD